MNKAHLFCVICKYKGKTHILDQLKRIDRILKNVKPTAESKEARAGIAILWDIHIKCPYGMSCPELEENQRRTKQAALDLEDRLFAVAVSDDKHLYHETLRHLSGDFPAAHRTIVRLHNRYHR